MDLQEGAFHIVPAGKHVGLFDGVNKFPKLSYGILDIGLDSLLVFPGKIDQDLEIFPERGNGAPLGKNLVYPCLLRLDVPRLARILPDIRVGKLCIELG
jgi:hypothetical protein